MEAGYDTLGGFEKAFRCVYGCTPSDYKQNETNAVYIMKGENRR